MLEILEEIHIFLHASLILKCKMTNYLPFIMLMLRWHNPELTAWSRVPLVSLIIAQLMKKPMVFYCIWRLMLFVRSCAWSLYWARGVQAIPSHLFTWTILILTSHRKIALLVLNLLNGWAVWIIMAQQCDAQNAKHCQYLTANSSPPRLSSSFPPPFSSSLLSVSSSSSSTIQAG